MRKMKQFLVDDFYDYEIPPLFRRSALGSGFVQLESNGRRYLIRHNISGRPQLMGRVASKFQKLSGKYHAPYILSHYLPYEERQALEALLVPYKMSVEHVVMVPQGIEPRRPPRERGVLPLDYGT